MGVTRFWRYFKEKMAELIAAGMVVQTKPGNVPQRKLYLDEGILLICSSKYIIS
jgi:5'-3' exonuclease